MNNQFAPCVVIWQFTAEKSKTPRHTLCLTILQPQGLHKVLRGSSQTVEFGCNIVCTRHMRHNVRLSAAGKFFFFEAWGSDATKLKGCLLLVQWQRLSISASWLCCWSWHVADRPAFSTGSDTLLLLHHSSDYFPDHQATAETSKEWSQATSTVTSFGASIFRSFKLLDVGTSLRCCGVFLNHFSKATALGNRPRPCVVCTLDQLAFDLRAMISRFIRSVHNLACQYMGFTAAADSRHTSIILCPCLHKICKTNLL